MKPSNRHLSAGGNRWVLSLLLAAAWLWHPAVRAGGTALDLTIKAVVVDQPCTLYPGDESISLDFGSVINIERQSDQRTPAKPFKIRLDKCDPKIKKQVKVTFAGQGSPENTDLLALAAGSAAKGVAIGLEQGDQSLPLNKASRPQTLVSGANELAFAAYVKLLPSGQAGLTPGAFNASATFKLDYD